MNIIAALFFPVVLPALLAFLMGLTDPPSTSLGPEF